MKKVILSLASLFAITFASAQEATTEGKGFKSGDVFISGSVGFGTTSTGDFSSDQFTVAPRAGFFVSDNIAVGLALGYTSQRTDEVSEFAAFEQKQSVFAIGGFGRYYFTPASDFSIFGQLSVAYATTKVETDLPGSVESKANGLNFGVAPGLSYFISDNFALEATFGVLGYTTAKPDFEGAESTDTFEFGLNMEDINLGLVYKF